MTTEMPDWAHALCSRIYDADVGGFPETSNKHSGRGWGHNRFSREGENWVLRYHHQGDAPEMSCVITPDGVMTASDVHLHVPAVFRREIAGENAQWAEKLCLL